MGRKRHVGDDEGIAVGHALQYRGQGVEPKIADMQWTARSSENLQSARMLAGEDPQQLVVKALRRGNDFVDLELWRNIQIIAHMACLEIEVDKRDLAVLRQGAVNQVNGGLNGER